MTVLVVTPLTGSLWKIESVGYDRSAYEGFLSPGQKIVETDCEWPVQGDWRKDDILWDDVAQSVILFPPQLRLQLYKQELLKTCSQKVRANPPSISVAELRTMVNNINAAADEETARLAAEKIDDEIKAYLIAAGLPVD